MLSTLSLSLPILLSLPLLSSPLSANAAAITTTSRLKSNSKIAAAWYTGYHASDYTLDDVPWSKYTQLMYSFAETTPDVNVVTFNGSLSPGVTVQDFVDRAHKEGVKAGVTIGGWTGSQFFSTAVGSAANRTAFVRTVVDLANKYDFDIVDFDWEYPGNQGIGCNTISPDDTSNFLSFLQELRLTPTGAKLTLSAATAIVPFYDSTGSPSSDVSAFAHVLNYIEVMNYDIWGSWSATVGPNAPLRDSCAASQNQQGSAESAVAAWTAAGFPASQIVLGTASYGHSFSVSPSNAFASANKLALYPPYNVSNQPNGDAWDAGSAGIDECGNYEAAGGVFDFWGLVDGGFLTTDGSVAHGISYVYDTCSQTPYVYNATSNVMISYDNPESFTAKGEFITEQGLLGFATWEAGGDYKNMLLDAILAGLHSP